MCEDVALLFRERAALEEEYGKRLARLSKSFSSRSEGGSLRESLEVVRLELEGSFALLIIYLLATAQTHLDLASDIRVKLDRPVSEFIANQAAVRKNVRRLVASYTPHHHVSSTMQMSRGSSAPSTNYRFPCKNHGKNAKPDALKWPCSNKRSSKTPLVPPESRSRKGSA